MRILSDFKDYYDYAQSFGQDPTLVFNRVEEEHSSSKEKKSPEVFKGFKSKKLPTILDSLLNFETSNNQKRLSISCFFVVLCGKLYPVVKVSELNSLPGVYEKSLAYFYDKEELVDYFNKMPESLSYYQVQCCEFLDLIYRPSYKTREQLARDVLFESCVENKKSLFSIEKRHFQYYLIENINLKEISFNKLLSGDQVYQELEMFLGLLKSQEPPVQVSNKDKIVAHGFDNKSFKHR